MLVVRRVTNGSYFLYLIYPKNHYVIDCGDGGNSAVTMATSTMLSGCIYTTMDRYMYKDDGMRIHLGTNELEDIESELNHAPDARTWHARAGVRVSTSVR